MLEVALAALALSGPKVCVFPPNPPPDFTCQPPPRAVPLPLPGSTGSRAPRPAPGNGFAGYLAGPTQIRPGERAYFHDYNLEASTLCYQVGTSRVRCLPSEYGSFYARIVRSPSAQYFTLRFGGKVIDRIVYRDVR